MSGVRWWTRSLSGVSAAAMLALPQAAAAQAARPEVFGGYSYLYDPSHAIVQANADQNSLRVGWMAGAARPILNDWLAIVGDVSGHRKRRLTFDGDVTLSFQAYMGGVRAAARIGPFIEFAQLLAGVVRSSGSQFGIEVHDSGFALQPGGGLDYPFASRLAARIEFDYRTVDGTDAGRERVHQLRAALSLVVYPWRP